MKLRTVRESREALQKLSGLTVLPAKTKFALARAMRHIEADLRSYDTVYNGLLEKHGEPDPDKPGLFHLTTNAKAFDTEVREVLDSDVDIPGVPVTVPAESLESLTVGELSLVDWLITVNDLDE